MAKSASLHSQLVFATQSSVFLDHFEPENIVVVTSRSGASEFQRLDAERLEAWRAEYTLGEIWENNVVGGGPYGMKRLYLTVEGQTEAGFVGLKSPRAPGARHVTARARRRRRTRPVWSYRCGRLPRRRPPGTWSRPSRARGRSGASGRISRHRPR